MAPYNVLMHHILFYDVVSDYVERRTQYREAHLAHAQVSVSRGDLVFGGALSDPADTAVIVFTSEAAAKAFAEADPYVLNGLVNSWRVRQWNTVVGTALKST